MCKDHLMQVDEFRLQFVVVIILYIRHTQTNRFSKKKNHTHTHIRVKKVYATKCVQLDMCVCVVCVYNILVLTVRVTNRQAYRLQRECNNNNKTRSYNRPKENNIMEDTILL